MDPQAPNVLVESAEVSPVPQTSQSPPSPQKVKDGHWISILAMAIFVVLTLGVVAFLYYQNQALKSMLASYQTPIASPTPIPSPTATIDPTANWKTYTDPQNRFTFKYPSNYLLATSTPVNLNKNITWQYNNTSFADCRGGCPAIDKTEQTTLDGKPATKVMGYLGQDGGNIPQSYITHEVFVDKKYFTFSIYALPIIMTNDEMLKYDQSKIQQIKPNDLDIYNQILSTFKFTSQNESQFCGGFAGTACPEGYSCKLDGKYPDAGGVCIKK